MIGSRRRLRIPLGPVQFEMSIAEGINKVIESAASVGRNAGLLERSFGFNPQLGKVHAALFDCPVKIGVVGGHFPEKLMEVLKPGCRLESRDRGCDSRLAAEGGNRFSDHREAKNEKPVCFINLLHRRLIRVLGVFLFIQLLCQIVLYPHFIDSVQLAFQPVNMHFLVHKYLFQQLA